MKFTISRPIILFTAFSFFFSSNLNLLAQINPTDSTAQVVSYWNLGEEHTLNIVHEKFKVVAEDTSKQETIAYDVGITVKDSTENSYLVEWHYKNFEVDSENELMEILIKTSEDIKVLIQTDQYGAIQEVTNWEEVRDYNNKMVGVMKQTMKQEMEKKLKGDKKKIPKKEQKKFDEGLKMFDNVINQMSMMYQSKEAIEASAIKDAHQFHTFHGGAYTLGEKLEGQMQLRNNFGGEPFDVTVNVLLSEINVADDFAVLTLEQEVDSEQLTSATYDYLEKLGTFGDLMPPREELPALTNVTNTTSIIHGSTGWTIFSFEDKQVVADGETNFEQRTIKLQLEE